MIVRAAQCNNRRNGRTPPPPPPTHIGSGKAAGRQAQRSSIRISDGAQQSTAVSGHPATPSATTAPMERWSVPKGTERRLFLLVRIEVAA